MWRGPGEPWRRRGAVERRAIMPTVSVKRDLLFQALGRTYSEWCGPARAASCRGSSGCALGSGHGPVGLLLLVTAVAGLRSAEQPFAGCPPRPRQSLDGRR